MKEFEFKESDVEGEATLFAVAEADHFNKWMYETILPHCKGEILEIGSGIGNISEYFVNSGQSITLSEIRQNYCDQLVQKFPELADNKKIIQMDISTEDFEERYNDQLESYDSVFALNVVEHIKDDHRALANCKKLLRKGGHLIILVPAYQMLYNQFDKELEHYRRYTKKSLAKIFVANNFELIHESYFNSLGIPGWFVSGKLQKNKIIPKGQMQLFNYVVPISKILDRVLFRKVGLSVICVGKKN